MVSVMSEQETDLVSFGSRIRQFVGQNAAVLCARYMYRGVVSYVGEDYFVFSNATVIENSGSAASETPSIEDAVFGSIFIKFDAIEMFFAPRWANAPLPGEQNWSNRTR